VISTALKMVNGRFAFFTNGTVGSLQLDQGKEPAKPPIPRRNPTHKQPGVPVATTRTSPSQSHPHPAAQPPPTPDQQTTALPPTSQTSPLPTGIHPTSDGATCLLLFTRPGLRLLLLSCYSLVTCCWWTCISRSLLSKWVSNLFIECDKRTHTHTVTVWKQ